MPILPDQKKSLQQLELERRANDLLRVYNPTATRLVVEWDRKNGVKLFPVEAEQDAVHVRYIARKYIHENFFKAVNQKAMEMVKAENERRVKGGMAEMDKTLKTGEQEQFESKFYGITSQDIDMIINAIETAQAQGKRLVSENDQLNSLQREAVEIVSTLFLGVESEYGVDRGPTQSGSVDFASVLEQSIVSEDQTPVSSTPKTFKCDFPGCDYESKHKIGLFQHKKTHGKELEAKKV